MRKIIVLSFISLDGVMQAPGGPKEDTFEGFKLGGWTVPYSDKSSGQMMMEQMSLPFDLLLGRKTYDIFASYLPNQDDKVSPIAGIFNYVNKYVVSSSSLLSRWQKTILINGDVVNKIQKLKKENGPNLQVHGSGELIQTLIKNDLVDELWLKIFPVTLGGGKKLFTNGFMPAEWQLMSSKVTPKGVIFASYKRSGELKTGSF